MRHPYTCAYCGEPIRNTDEGVAGFGRQFCGLDCLACWLTDEKLIRPFDPAVEIEEERIDRRLHEAGL